MKYVVDSSVAFKWAVVEAFTPEARRLRDDFIQGDHDLLAPDVFPIELAHALTRAERQGRITPVQGGQFLRDFLTTLPRMSPSLPLLSWAYALSSQMRIGVYDCLYVALANQEQCQFVTADDRLIRTLHRQFPFVTALTALP